MEEFSRVLQVSAVVKGELFLSIKYLHKLIWKTFKSNKTKKELLPPFDDIHFQLQI